MTIITLAWSSLQGEGISRGHVELARRLVVEYLLPGEINRDVVEHYVRKALRSNAWTRLKRESRALLLATRSLKTIKSRVLRGILEEIFLEIELSTLRGRAVFYGVLLALRQGLIHILGDIKRIITLGVGYLNLPLPWRILG